MWFFARWPSWLKIFLTIPWILLLIIIIAKFFLIEPNRISGPSMSPTLQNGEYIIVSKIAYRSQEPQRGDIVTYSRPGHPDVSSVGRIIGLPNEEFSLRGGLVYINNDPLPEPYLQPGTPTYPELFIQDSNNLKIPEGFYIILGDNRQKSSDSREFGFVPKENLIGKYLLSYSKP